MIEFWLDSDGNNDDNDSLSNAVKPYILKAAPATSTATAKRVSPHQMQVASSHLVTGTISTDGKLMTSGGFYRA
jgi:hypothetical protein